MKNFSIYLRCLFNIYIVGFIFFFLFRIVLFFNFTEKFAEIPANEYWNTLLSSFLMGFRFDNVISAYILLLPALIAIIFSFLKGGEFFVLRFIKYWSMFFYSLAFIACGTDIPFFKHYFNRLNISIFNFNDYLDFAFKMIIEDSQLLFFTILGIAIVVVFLFIIQKIYEHYKNLEETNIRLYKKIATSLLIIILLFISARGRLEIKSPIRIGTAYFSNYAIANKFGLNPVFTFVQSYIASKKYSFKKLNLIDNTLAYQNVKRIFSVSDTTESPFEREIIFKQKLIRKNIVLVIMESMCAEKMGVFGNQYHLTPNLDSLASKNIFFTNYYTSGIHTYNGIYSSIFGMPSLLNQHPMKANLTVEFNGLPFQLKKAGYENIYLTTHDGQFDNVSGFMYRNGVDKVISKKDYNREEVLSTLGVPDHVLFREAIKYLNQINNSGKPFFAAMMTASDHEPRIIPEDIDFEPRNSDRLKSIVEYADWAIGRFLAEASKQKWYNNTIFVFTSDHGANFNSIYEMPLTMHHSPLIIFEPNKTNRRKINYPVLQIDIFPTIMGMLNINYINLTPSIDILNNPREVAYFTADDKIGALNSDYYYTFDTVTKKEFLYKYRTGEKINYINEKNDVAKELKRYAFSNLQATGYIIKNKLLK